jgi:hypothetical protein
LLSRALPDSRRNLQEDCPGKNRELCWSFASVPRCIEIYQGTLKMRIAKRSRIVSALLGVSICLPVAALAQSQDSSQSASQDSSVADAARRSRDKKKNPSTTSKSTRVITDDDLAQRNYQPGPDVLNLGAAANQERIPGSTEAADNATVQDTKEAQEQDAREAKEQDADIAKLKLQLAEGQRNLDLAQRQLALDQDTHFANPEYAHDVAGKAKLDAEKQQIADKQQEIEGLKSRLAALEELKSHRKPARAQAAPAPQPQKPSSTENPAQTEKPPQTENPPSASPLR